MSRSYRNNNIVPVLVIIILCFLVYIASILPRFLDFLNYNVVQLFGLRPATFIQMPWTIVTNLFVHVDIWHLLFNMMTLYFFGTFLLRLVRVRTFLVIYLLGGIVGNVFILLLQMHSNIPVIGASGAIFALGGTLAVLTPRLRVYVFPIPVPMPLWVAVIGIFFILSFIPGISWQGHLGGLVTGLIYGFILRKRVRTPLS